jgi:phospholipid transport system substrate-binding protein
VIGLGLAGTVVWAGEPTDAMRDFFGAVNLVLTDPRTEDQPIEKLKAIRRHVDDVFDFREAAMLALGREWAAHPRAEQNAFVALFADLLERSFVWRVAGKASLGGGVKVQYLGETVAGDTATVDTTVASRDGNDIQLEYRMVRRADRWVVRDVVMDGVSTMENYHAQFQRVVRDASWHDLMGQLRAKVGTPSVQVAAASVTGPTVRPVPVTPLATPEVDRPADDRYAAARDLAAVVTPGLAVRDVNPLPVPRPRPVPVAPETNAPATPVRGVPRESVTGGGPSRVIERAAPSIESTPRLAAVSPPAEPGFAAKPVVAHPAMALWIQVGAFRNAAIAGRIAMQVKGEIFVAPPPASAGAHAEPLLRVRVGPFVDRVQAIARLRQLQGLGYQPFLAAP